MKGKKPKKVASNKKAIPKRSQLALDVYGPDGKVCGFENLPKEIFSVSAPKSLLAQAVRVYLAGARKGTASTKTRAEVRGGGRKPWRQKGTGRARAGSIRDPQWRKGGIVFGPKPRDFSLALPKKMKKRALFAALSFKLKEKQIICVTGLSKLGNKTKQFLEFLSKLPIAEAQSKEILLILAKKNEQVIRAVRNLRNLSCINIVNLNPYQVLKTDFLLLEKEALTTFEETFLKHLGLKSSEVLKSEKEKRK
jgi:large subunit ribosomal protein L4